MTDRTVSRFRKIGRITIAVGAIFLLTFIFHVAIPVNATTIGFLYLLAILVIAVSFGLSESVISSIAATACFNYFFLPPRFTWTVADPENWVALFTLLISSLLTSELSNRAKRRAIEAKNHQDEMERLYALSRALMLIDLKQPSVKQIAQEIAHIFESPFVAVFDQRIDEIYATAAVTDIEWRMRDAVTNEVLEPIAHAGVTICTFGPGDQVVGSFGIRAGRLSEKALDALRNLITTNLESARSREIAMRAEAARQSEEFKSTLLDGLAHEFKTPLTSIKAVTTALLTSSVPNMEQQHELLMIVDQETERLNRLVNEAIHLARIEAGKVQLNRQVFSVMNVLQQSLQETAHARNGRPIDMTIVDNFPTIEIDRELIQMALRQLIHNAVNYSPLHSPIKISVTSLSDCIAIGIHNWGEALPESEQLRIFDKFYRGHNSRHQTAGAGMGLAIAREIFRAHGGDIRVESSADRGTEFVAWLPCLKKEVSKYEFVADARG